MKSEVGRFRDVDSAFAYIESFTNLERRQDRREYRLERMRFLLERFGHPEEGTRYVHVAGSKGKGSTATFIAAAFAEAGIPTGLYRSPHVEGYRERITLASKEFPDPFYIDLVEEVRDGLADIRADGGEPVEPTTFELLTLMAFIAFNRSGCRWAIMETGIGGRLDATNVIVPEASVLTPVELEHTDILGTTLKAIAGEKAGIIKPHRPVFSSAQAPEVLEVFRERAKLLGCKFTLLSDEVTIDETVPTAAGTRIALQFADGKQVEATLRLIGSIQAENAALAALVARHLLPETEVEVLKRGLELAFLPGRMEMVSRAPEILLDGAHTPASIAKVVATYRRLHPDTPAGAILLFAAVDGKRQEEMAALLAPVFDQVIITTPGFFKPSSPDRTLEIFRALNPHALLIADPQEALREAVTRSGSPGSAAMLPILVTGSFYLVSEVRKLVPQLTRREVDHEITT